MITAGGSHPVIPETPIAVYVKLIALLIVSDIIQTLKYKNCYFTRFLGLLAYVYVINVKATR